jgi:hypothetical protein
LTSLGRNSGRDSVLVWKECAIRAGVSAEKGNVDL